MNITKKNNTAEIIVFSLFLISSIFISFFHEPWFDELQSWGISKASIYDILFVIPHYEGHPPLWTLILKPFSSLHLYPDLGLKMVNLTFIFISIWLLIFKSPFPKIVKFTLPFTYFLFYQYGMLSRPYSIYCLGVFLCATLYKSKDEHPFLFMFSLLLLSLSSSFGLAVAGGIALVWVIDLLKQKQLFKNNSSLALLFLFICSLIIIYLILPANNAYAAHSYAKQDVLVKILYTIILLPADSLVTDFFNYTNNILKYIDILYFIPPFQNQSMSAFLFSFYIYGFIGIIINCYLFYFCKNRKTLLIYLLPSICFFVLVFYIFVAITLDYIQYF